MVEESTGRKLSAMLKPQMATGSTRTQDLADVGVRIPAWPEEPAGSGTEGDWIQRGQAYAEGVLLFRAQLHRAVATAGTEIDRLSGLLRDTGRLSPWHQDVAHLLLADLQDTSGREWAQPAARLVGRHGRTASQLLGAALSLATFGPWTCALHGIKRLIEEHELNSDDCIEVCARLALMLQPRSTDKASRGASHEYRWFHDVETQCHAIRLLTSALGIACEGSNREALIVELESFEELASERPPHGGIAAHEALQLVSARENRKQARATRRPLLRTIHHFACTGGTVICKCLAAMPEVALISEVNPLNRCGSEFEPSNPLLLLERSYRPLSTREIKENFIQQMGVAYDICQHDDVDLLVRDHSHTDFCSGTAPSEVCPVVDYLSEHYDLISVVTVRHPLDSYLGMRAQKWDKQFSPSTLEEYSRRYMAFLDRYQNLPIRTYESFCDSPQSFMEDVCRLLEICYHPGFIDKFGNFSLTGDSGRKSNSVISRRPRRRVPADVLEDIKTSPTYAALLRRLGYIEDA